MVTSTDDTQRTTKMRHLQEALRLGLAVVTELWSFSAKDWVSSVHAADIDGDGDIEVLIGSRHFRLYVLTKLGDLKWQKEFPSEWIGSVVGIDDPGALDKTRIVVGARDNTVSALNESGDLIWQYAADMVVRQITVGDINHDGKTEVIFGSEDRYIHALSCEDGTLLWKYPTNAWVRAVCIADIDQDGMSEILAGSGDSNLYTLDCDGQLKWSYHAESKIYAIFAVDLDYDGKHEILVSTDAKDLYVLTAERQKKWSVQLENRVLSIYVTDLNNDGHLEILAGSEDKHLYVYSDTGELLWKHYIGARIFSVYATDVDRDGIQEVFLGSGDDNVHALRIELAGGELENIRRLYTQLGHPPINRLNLSPTQSALLHVLTNDIVASNASLSLRDLPAVQRNGPDHFALLSTLLELQEQKAQPLWQRNVGYIRSVDLGNVVGDKQLEIVVGTGQGTVCAVGANGDQLWSYSFDDRVRAVQIGDVDADGLLEVVVGSIDGRVYVLDEHGQAIKWEFKVHDWITGISLARSEPSGHLELVMGSEEKRIHVYDDHLAPTIEPFLAPKGIYVILADDINQDGIPEIIAGAIDDNVYTYTKDGTLLWAYKTLDRVRALTTADIDGDQHKEIIVGAEDRSVYVLDDTGHLKWRYYASHRVLDVYAADIDQDGQVEVLLGGGDGSMYVLNSEGDLLWRYAVNDRIRAIRVADVNTDGIQEIVVGTEDHLYLLQVLDAGYLTRQIAVCWQALTQKQTPTEILTLCLQQHSPLLRRFALQVLAQQPELFGEYPPFLPKLITDPDVLVRCGFAEAVPALYQYYPEQMRRFFDLLSGDPVREVRMAFVDSLAALIPLNHELVFAYFERFTRSVDMWVRRAMVRKLYRLVSVFPQQVFRLLVITAQDETAWVRQETGRTLARYFDLHTDNLLEGIRTLISRGINLEVYRLIVHRATLPVIQNVFRVMIDLFYELNETNVQVRLRAAVQAFDDTKTIRYGLENWQVYQELYRLVRMRNLDEIARYKYAIHEIPVDNWLHFEGTLRILRQLTGVSTILNTYLRREGVGDRLASLLEANKAIDAIYSEVKEKIALSGQETQQLSDIVIFRILLKRWRELVSSEMSRLVGRADLRLELETKSVAYEELISVWLNIHNDGNSPADNVLVRLLDGEDFTLISKNNIVLETVPSRDTIQVEFTIKPLTITPRLTFELMYDDAGGKGRVRRFADRLELRPKASAFAFIPNPYSAGMPIRDPGMFYGRQEDLAVLKADLASSAANMTIVLYGQRRSGKTSLLNQLVNTEVMTPHIPIYVDMQNESLGITISRFLRNIAYYIQRALSKRGISVRPPELRDFEDDPTFVFNCFLDDIECYLRDQKLILLIDEFEILEQKVNEHALPQEIFEYLRSLMQHRQSVSFLFSGTHTIKQLTAGYWSVFFNIARHYRLSKLGEEDARQLIVKPVEGILEYDAFSIQKIRQLTADQPYLIQLICRALVDHCNHFHKNYVTINDVNTVLGVVMETGEVHFQWMWEQTGQQERIILSILAQAGGEDCLLVSVPDIEEIYAAHGLSYDHKLVLKALFDLREKEFIESRSDETRFRILLGLSQRWLSGAKTLRRVMLEENLLIQK